MKRFTVEHTIENSGIVYYIFDNYFKKYFDHDGYTDINTADWDCQELNDWEEIENYREYG